MKNYSCLQSAPKKVWKMRGKHQKQDPPAVTHQKHPTFPQPGTFTSTTVDQRGQKVGIWQLHLGHVPVAVKTIPWLPFQEQGKKSQQTP